MLLIFGFYLNIKKDDDQEFKRKFDLVYQVALTQSLRDTIQTLDIAELKVRMNTHEARTNEAILQIQQSMLASNKVMMDADKYSQQKEN